MIKTNWEVKISYKYFITHNILFHYKFHALQPLLKCLLILISRYWWYIFWLLGGRSFPDLNGYPRRFDIVENGVKSGEYGGWSITKIWLLLRYVYTVNDERGVGVVIVKFMPLQPEFGLCRFSLETNGSRQFSMYTMRSIVFLLSKNDTCSIPLVLKNTVIIVLGSKRRPLGYCGFIRV